MIYKFRAFCTLHNEWIAEGFHLLGEVTLFNLIDLYYTKKQIRNYQDCVKVSIFTNLYDKNGKEIYENDFVEDTGNFKKEKHIRQVMYKPECAGFVLCEENDYFYFNHSFGANDKGICTHLEIIGNLYESKQ